MDSLQLIAAHRAGWRSGAGFATERHWLDFEVNGARLSHLLRVGDKVGVFGWLGPRHQRAFADELLSRRRAALPSGRATLYLCPECADEGCGVISVEVVRAGDAVVWRDFHCEAGASLSTRIEAPQFVFDAAAYRVTLMPQRG